MVYQSPWTYWAGDLRSGKLFTELPVMSDSWDHGFNIAGSITASLALDDPDVQFVNPVSVLEPARCFLAVSRAGRIFNAGPVWRHDWNPDTGILTVKAVNIWSYFDRRYVYPLLNTPIVNNDGSTSPSGGVALTSAYTDTTIKDPNSGAVSNLSLRGAVAKLLNQAESHTGGQIPLITQYDGEIKSSEPVRKYYGYQMKTLGDVLRGITTEDNGPDIRFDAQFNPSDPTSIQWVLNMGTPFLGQTDQAWVYDQGSNLRQVLSVARDGMGIANRVIATGAGQDIGLVNAVEQNSSSIAQGYPMLESLISISQETSAAVLDQKALGAINSFATPQETWSVRVSTDDYPALESVNPGDTATFKIINDPYLGTVNATARILTISYTGAATDCVDLSLSVVRKSY
jgi:hypothetical protein